MYIFDTNVFLALGIITRLRFPTIWDKLDSLVNNNQLISVREVRRELNRLCSYDHISNWIDSNREIFVIPADEECDEVASILAREQYRGIVKRKNISNGFAVADPFLIAIAKVREGIIVTQETFIEGGARIPTICKDLNIQCINLEKFFELEKINY